MKRIDEVIEVANENDRYGEPHIFEEADADDRWMIHVAKYHERRRAILRPRLPRFPRDTQGSSSDMADGSKGKNMGTRDFSNTNGSSAIESDSSDDEDMEEVADDAERECILKIFEDFPTVIQKARHLPAVDSDDHGIMVMSNPESGWSHIDPEKLPPRIRQYLAKFTILDAVAFPDGVYPDLSLNGGGSHRWLLATARKEFICDTSTQNVWYRPIENNKQPNSPQQPL